MLKFVTTLNNCSFVYDTDTLAVRSHILTADFILMMVTKTLRMVTPKNGGEKYLSVDYEYPSLVFKNQNMCGEKSITSERDASLMEIEIFQDVSSNKSLSKNAKEYLRNSSLKVIDQR